MATLTQRLSLKRGITSYGKVQSFISALIRGREAFVSKKNISSHVLLNVGCGTNTNPEFINLDYHWMKSIDICWDITKKPYPIPDGHLEGIYTEHCLEHIPLTAFQFNIKEFYRMLKPGGTVRIVMPDGELYFDLYQRKKNGENVQMPHEENYITPMARINGLFRNYGHQFIHDFATVKTILEQAGFKDIVKTSYRNGRDPRLLIDMEWRRDESLYVEAVR